jgi:hypothetical protein
MTNTVSHLWNKILDVVFVRFLTEIATIKKLIESGYSIISN